MHERLKALRELLDRHVVGHADAKHALLLGLVCREHLYLEGPPGSAKTRMAELAARGSGLRFFFHQLHRDTRLSDLAGDVVLERRALEGGAGERIAQRIEPGGVLTAEVCVLDDLSRAPGEALNVLLRVLQERRFGDQPLPLLCAIATGNPQTDEYYNEPLDPATLDRFALQLRVGSLLQSRQLEAARALLDGFARGTVEEHPDPSPVLARADLDAVHAALPGVDVPDAVKAALLELLRRLVIDHGCDESRALLTDRTFLVKAVKLLRGQALLAGRERVLPEDLHVIELTTTFRVPDEVHAALPRLIAGVIG
jgi:MoxR-like ATPase